MIDENILVEVFDKKTIDIINALLSYDTDFFSIRELADKANVTVSTTFRIVKSLEKIGFIKKIQRGRVKFFQIQKPSKAYKQFAELLGQKRGILDIIRSKVEESINSDDFEVLCQKKDKKKIFLITDQEIDDSQLNTDINQTTGQKIKLMCISKQQYNKMKDMGLV
jgi:DNA-binding transcriptional regulator YhcF (GntR family)